MDFDETIEDSRDERYFGFWGLQYDYERTMRVSRTSAVQDMAGF